MESLYERFRAVTRSNGATLFGVADLDRIRADTDLLDARYNVYARGISVGVTLNDESLATITAGPTPEYCEEYLRANRVLDTIASALVEEIRSTGGSSIAIPASEVVDWERLRGHLPHKLIARYAGLGWIGRSILLINPEFGARVRYVTVLTNIMLPADAPMDADCGECVRCVAVCPANAPKNEPAHFDLRACFDKLAEFNERLDKPHFICGLCVKICKGK